jgi:hypothetical protein
MSMSMQIELFEALTEAGIKPEAARKVERQVERAISAGHDALRSELLGIVANKTDVAELRAATKADIAELRVATKADIAELRAATKADIAELRADVHKTINFQMWRLVLFIVAATTLTQGIFKFLT